MSELIDSVFDVAKISKEVSDITASLDGLKTVISTYSADVKKMYDATRASKSGDDLAKNAKAINEAMVAGKKAVEEYTAVEKELIAQKKQLEQVEAKRYAVSSNNNKEIVTNKKLLAEQNELLKLNLIINDKNSGSLEKAVALNKKLEIEKKKLNLETSEGKRRLEEINKIQDENNKLLEESGNAAQKQKSNIGNYKSALSGLVDSFKNGEIGAKQLGKGVVQLGKQMVTAFITNPVFLAIAAIVLVIKQITKAFSDSEERTNKLNLAFAQFKPILRTIGDGFEFLADIVIKVAEGMGKAISKVLEFLRINPKGAAAEFVEAEKLKQTAILETRKLNEQASEQEAIIAEQREKINDKENFTFKERMEALKLAGEAQKKLADDRAKIAELNLKALQAEAALDDNNAEMNEKLSAAIVAVNNARRESAEVARALLREENKMRKEEESERRAAAAAAKAAAKEREDAEKERVKKIIELNRMLRDSEIAIMEEGEEKQIAISEESFKRKIEDLKANGQLTRELEANLTKAHEIELQKIRDDAEKERKNKEKENVDKRIVEFEKNVQREADALSASYREKEVELKKQLANGILSREKYEADLIALQSEALKEVNDNTIKSLQKELEIVELSADKRAEISAKIRDLQIQNENASLDATIDANQKKIDADKEAFNKRLQIAEQLSGAGMELFAAVSDFQAQEHEKRMAELDALQEKNDEYFDKQQKNLDNAIMSEESRFLAQKKIDEDREKREKAIAERKRAEELRRAKWEKAQAVTSAVISTALATIKAFVDPGGVLGAVFAVLAAATGAAQIATILSRPIPAYKDGGVTGSGLALWGEERPEVAVTRAGHIMYAERPTLQNFDAGTRIYKSVEDFERNIASGGSKSFEFDYDKMAQMLPKHSIELNGNGSWTMIDKENNRKSEINRRTKLN